MKENPLHHFELHPLVHLNLMGIDISLNKGIFIMWVGLALVFGMFMLIRQKASAWCRPNYRALLKWLCSF